MFYLGDEFGLLPGLEFVTLEIARAEAESRCVRWNRNIKIYEGTLDRTKWWCIGLFDRTTQTFTQFVK